MLRVGKDKNILLQLSDKEKTFTKDFIFALSLALLFHLIAFFLFRISPLITKGSKIVLAPVSATAELSEHVTHSDLEQVRYKKIPEFQVQEPLAMELYPPEGSTKYLFDEFP